MDLLTASQRHLMADTTLVQGSEEQNRRKAREILNGMSHYRIEPTKIKIKDPTAIKMGGQGVVTVGTLSLSEKTKEFVSMFNVSAEWVGLSLEEQKNSTPQQKRVLKEQVLETLKAWIPDLFTACYLEINAAVDMAGMPPEALKEWLPQIKVAVKMLEWNRNDSEESTKFFKSFVHELSLTAELSHPNIIQLTGFVEDMEKGDAWIVLPWAANGNVREFLQSGEWDLPERISLIQGTAKGLEYLHSRQPPICHGDLKSLNILVNSSYRAVITDFGSARVKQHVALRERESPSERPQGALVDDGTAEGRTSPAVKFDGSTLNLTLTGPKYSLRWIAPEVVGCGEEQDLPSDVWAIGWICWEIITGKLPFEGLDTPGAIINCTVMGTLPAIREHTDLSHILKLCSLMSECWSLEPGKRIDASAFQRRVHIMPSETPSGSASRGQKTRSARLLIELGKIYSLQGNNEKALSYYQSAMDVATRAKDEWAKGAALASVGGVYRTASEHSKAEKAFMEAYEIFSRGGYESAADALAGLGHIYRIQGKHHQAEKALSEAHQMFSHSGNEVGAGHALHGLAETYCLELKHHEAERAYMDAHEVHSRIGHDLGAANALLGLGEIYRVHSKHREAEKVFVEAHEIYSRIGDRRGVANALVGLGHTYRAQSRFEEAEKAFNDDEALPSDSERQGAANRFRSLGMLYQDQGKHNEAEVSYRQALAAYDHAGNPRSRGETLLALGELYHAQGRYSDAEEAIAEALAIGVSLDNDQLRAGAHSVLLRIFRSQSKHKEELELLIQAGPSFARIGRHEAHAASLAQLGATHVAQGMYAEAEEYYRHAQAICSSIEDATGEASVLFELQFLYVRQGRHHEAEECFDQAHCIAHAAAADEGDEAKALDVLKKLSAALRKPEDAKVLMETCECLSQTGKHAQHAASLKHLGDILGKEGAYVEAEESYRQAQAIFLSLEDVPGEARVLTGLGCLYVRQGRREEAEQCFAQARVAYAMVADEDGEAKALEYLMGVYVFQRKFADAKVTCMEACELYTQRGQPMSATCAIIWELLQRVEESPLNRDRCEQALSSYDRSLL